MKKKLLASCLLLPVISSCSFETKMKDIETKAAQINKYENVSLLLAKENREQRVEIKRLEFEIQKLRQELIYKESNAFNSDLARTNNSNEIQGSRGIASVGKMDGGMKDFVEFGTYKWSAEDMLKIADKEFKAKNFEKAAQFYNSIINYYSGFEKIDDNFLFKAGISSYETGVHHDWTMTHFNNLMKHYPKSAHFRSAKLWVALTHMKLGEKEKFFVTVEEFRKKYRNTKEWKILSSYYESIAEKTNE